MTGSRARRAARGKALIAVIAATLLTVTVPASAHYVYQGGDVWESGHWKCIWAQAEISDGLGPGYSKAELGASQETQTPVPFVGTVGCSRGWFHAAGELRVRIDLYKKVSGSYSFCTRLSWTTNPVSEDRERQMKHWAASDMCGAGTYMTKAWAGHWWQGAWVDRPMNSGDHSSLGKEPETEINCDVALGGGEVRYFAQVTFRDCILV
jgi:hypothetical protein